MTAAWRKISSRQLWRVRGRTGIGCGPGNPDGYVHTVLVRLSATWSRRRWRGEVPTETLPERGSIADQADDRLHLVRALRRLPLRQRQVVVLRYVDDLPLAEVAAILGIGEGTVKSQASRGLATLRKELGDE